jgi:hypothetical protein
MMMISPGRMFTAAIIPAALLSFSHIANVLLAAVIDDDKINRSTTPCSCRLYHQPLSVTSNTRY